MAMKLDLERQKIIAMRFDISGWRKSRSNRLHRQLLGP